MNKLYLIILLSVMGMLVYEMSISDEMRKLKIIEVAMVAVVFLICCSKEQEKKNVTPEERVEKEGTELKEN